jgi:hypothetical protein
MTELRCADSRGGCPHTRFQGCRDSNRWNAVSENTDYDSRNERNLKGKWEMALTELEKVLGSVAAQLMNGEEVLLEDHQVPVRRVGSGRLRMLQFKMNGRVFEAIEQNREKPSRWGKFGTGEASGGAVSRCRVAQVCGAVGGWGSTGVWEVSCRYRVASGYQAKNGRASRPSPHRHRRSPV